MEEGIQIAEELLWTLADSTSGTDDQDENVVMDDVPADTQLEELRRCVEAFRPRVEAMLWYSL